ncbi:hypothetical protein [Brevibacillus sp. SYSU BS000544]|uniref:hypothetical protein n=1 Tax=Brevibacillus sp. SYSU BS000544 TaxID=3416443 RepID=UPI003CE4A334
MVITWLQGGPFLEVSFLFQLKENKKATVTEIINKLSESPYKIKIVDDNIEEVISSFVKGYPYDEEDPNTIYIHSVELRLFIEISRERKVSLIIEQISSDSIIVDFHFYGDKDDAPEWNQIGVKEEEYTYFRNFLISLFSIYDFLIGGISWEEDIRFLFDCNEIAPNECYRNENLSPEYFLKHPSCFTEVIWNEKVKKIGDIPYPNIKIKNNGILITFKELCSLFH